MSIKKWWRLGAYPAGKLRSYKSLDDVFYQQAE